MPTVKRFRLLLVPVVGLLIALAVGWGCWSAPRPIPAYALGTATTIQIYSAGRPISERKLELNSVEEKYVREWLREHSTGWQPSLLTYVPVHRIDGPDFSLNFTGRSCVLNFKQPDGNWMQVVRQLGENESPPEVFGLLLHAAVPIPRNVLPLPTASLGVSTALESRPMNDWPTARICP